MSQLTFKCPICGWTKRAPYNKLDVTQHYNQFHPGSSLPELDTNARTIISEHLKLEKQGWDRDKSVTEPTEPPP